MLTFLLVFSFKDAFSKAVQGLEAICDLKGCFVVVLYGHHATSKEQVVHEISANFDMLRPVSGSLTFFFSLEEPWRR